MTGLANKAAFKPHRALATPAIELIVDINEVAKLRANTAPTAIATVLRPPKLSKSSYDFLAKSIAPVMQALKSICFNALATSFAISAMEVAIYSRLAAIHSVNDSTKGVKTGKTF